MTDANLQPLALPPWLSRRACRILLPALAFLGVECWLNLGGGLYGPQHQPLILLAALVLGLLPPINRIIDRLWQQTAHPRGAIRAVIALALWINSSVFLYVTVRGEHIPLIPKYQDEFSYLIQSRMLAHGRFWMPALPNGTFFESFYLLTSPAYASMYFPGAAMLDVPTVWLGLPYYAGPLVEAGACVALVYLIFSEILDSPSGLLAALLMLATGMFRLTSVQMLAQIPMLLMGLAMTFAWLRWSRGRRWGWLALLGAAMGFGAITRPADAVVFALVLAVATALQLGREPLAAWLKTFTVVAAAAAPFLLLQAFINHGVTGHWLRTPFTEYADRYYPGVRYGFHAPPPTPLHVSDVPQKQLFYEKWVYGNVREHRWATALPDIGRRFCANVPLDIPDPFLWLLMPMSLLGLWNRRFWAVWGVLPIFFIVYAGYALFLPHYVVTFLPAMLLLILLPIRVLTDALPGWQAAIRAVISLMIVGLCIAVMPQLDRTVHDAYFESPALQRINTVLCRDVKPPAVVLFHFNVGSDFPSEEPVYNTDVAWPYDAPVIRAHDLNPSITAIGKPGDRDRPLYVYFAQHEPRRIFYLYDRGGDNGRLTRLGSAAELAERAAPSAPDLTALPARR